MDVKDSPIEKSVEITLGGQPWQLSYPLPALWAFEDATGVDLTAGFDEEKVFGKGFRQRTERLAILCWAGLVTFHPELKREQVANWIFIGNLKYVEDKAAEALFSTLPGAEPKEEATQERPLAEPPVSVV